MTKIKGKIIKGHGEANKTLKMQWPYFETYLPDLESYYQGTLNIDLKNTLPKYFAEIITNPIEWDTRQNPIPTEIFKFKKITFEINNTKISALIYEASNSPHNSNPKTIEIIAPKIKAQNGDICYISL